MVVEADGFDWVLMDSGRGIDRFGVWKGCFDFCWLDEEDNIVILLLCDNNCEEKWDKSNRICVSFKFLRREGVKI